MLHNMCASLTSPTASLFGHLQEVTEALATTEHSAEIVRIVLQSVLVALNGTAGVVLLMNDAEGRLEVAASEGLEGAAQACWLENLTVEPGPVADAIDQQQPRFVVRDERAEPPAPASTGIIPMVLENRSLGAVLIGFQEPHPFTAEEQGFLKLMAAHCAVAIRRVRQSQAQQALIQERTAALDAFAAFTEAVGLETDQLLLAQQAMQVIRSNLTQVSTAYYEQEDGLWKARLWSEDMPAEVVADIRRGVPLDAPNYAEGARSAQGIFIDGWNAEANSLAISEMYGAVAFFPIRGHEGGETIRLLAVGTYHARAWLERERSLMRAVGRSLDLAMERAVSAQQLKTQNAELEAHSRVLEAFAELSRDLAGETNRYALIHRAQEIMLSLLTPGYALYWEAGDTRWVLKSQVGDIGNAKLQRLVDEQGLPLDAPALHSTWLTGEPNYQDRYDQGTDTPAEMIRHVHAATAFQVKMYGKPIGMLAVGLFDQRRWTPMDKSALETAVYSLGLVLERAQSLEVLAERSVQLESANAELQVSNAELEAFTYSASHDLRTPVRHVMGFSELAQQALGTAPNEKAQRYLEVVKQGALRMNAMIDGMLSLSTSGRQALRTESVDLNDLVTQARKDVSTEFAGHPVRWLIGDLPRVWGDLGLLQQVITNLLSNAVKYSAKRELSVVEVWSEERESEWRISVKDNGVGFDPTYAQKLFGIFQRLHSDHEFQGTGVGLATVKRIVLKHGGQVSAESQVQAGAIFSFTLPMER